MKKLLAVGCSYTQNYGGMNRLGLKFPMWPEILAEKLGMECYNFGSSGQGNSYILEKTYDQINKTNWDLVVLMWSEFQRLDFETKPPSKSYRPETSLYCLGHGWKNIHHFRDNLRVNELLDECKVSLLKIANIHAMTQRSIRFFHIIQILLKDIPYIMVQGTRPIGRVDFANIDILPEKMRSVYYNHKKIRAECAKSMLSSPFLNKIDDSKFMGFPILEEIGGWCMDDMIDKKDPNRTIMRLSAEDTHPNDKGNEYMAELIYEYYKKIYL